MDTEDQGSPPSPTEDASGGPDKIPKLITGERLVTEIVVTVEVLIV